MPKIFVSYRRDDSADAAGRLHDRLSAEFGKTSVFIDVDNIPFGVDFRKHLANAVGNCDVLLAIMGDEWLDARDRDGQRRLDDESDFVRIEIATALQRQIPVIPILVGINSVPKPDQLPEDLRELAFRNAAEIRAGVHFASQVDRLVTSIRDGEKKSPPKPPVLVGKRANPVSKPPQPKEVVPTASVKRSAAKPAPSVVRQPIPLWRHALLLYAPRNTAALIFRLLFFPAFAVATLMSTVTLFLETSVENPSALATVIVKMVLITTYYACAYVPFWLPAKIFDSIALPPTSPHVE